MMTNPRRATGARNESLQSAVQRIFDDAGRSTKTAVDALIIEIRKRPSFHEEAYRIAAETLVDEQVRADRARIMRGQDIGSMTVPSQEVANDQPPTFTPQSEASKAASGAAFKRFAAKLTGLYLTPFKHNGQEYKLGTATPEQLRPIAAHYRAQGADMVRKARWLDKVVASAKEGEPIYMSLGLKELERMQADAFNSEV